MPRLPRLLRIIGEIRECRIVGNDLLAMRSVAPDLLGKPDNFEVVGMLTALLRLSDAGDFGEGTWK